MTKTCKTCGEEKELDLFAFTKIKRKKGIVTQILAHCKKCNNKKKYERMKRNPISLEKYKERCRKRTMAYHYSHPQASTERGKLYVERKIANGTYKDNWLKVKYGINMEEYDKIKKEQNFSCAICKTPEDKLKRPLHVDHCHTSGKIRGLLCFRCNSGIGHFVDRIDFLESAITYLKENY